MTTETDRAISDEEACRIMLPAARKYAWRYGAQGWDIVDDLIQEGMMGAMEAARTFDPSRGLKFCTYAYRRVVGRMIDHVRTNQSFAKRLDVQLAKADGRDVAQLIDLDSAGWRHVDPPHHDPEPLGMSARRHFGRFARRLTRHGLTAEELEVLASRYVEGLTGEQIGERMGVNDTRVSQIHSRAVAEIITADAEQLERAYAEASR